MENLKANVYAAIAATPQITNLNPNPMLILIAKNKYSLVLSLTFEFNSIHNEDRLLEIYTTTKDLGFTEEASEMKSELIAEGIINED